MQFDGKRVAIRVSAVIAAIYLVFCGLLYFHQAHFLFFPQSKIEFTPKDYGCAFEDVSIGPDRLGGWWLATEGKPSLIYYHGNGGNVGDNAAQACRLHNLGFNVLVFDYRGYGKSPGNFPSEKKIYEDAGNAWHYVESRGFKHQDIIIYGHSLGGAVAIEMAKRHSDAAGVIAESTFTSIYDMGTRDRTFRLFPLRFLVTERMNSIAKVPQLKMPVLFIHGKLDKVVPSDMSQTLFDSAPQPKTLVWISNAGHEDCAAVGGPKYREAVLNFVGSLHPSALTAAAK